jgi:hypothetical protein
MPSQFEEIVGRSHFADIQHFAPDLRHQKLDLVVGRNVSFYRLLPVAFA